MASLLVGVRAIQQPVFDHRGEVWMIARVSGGRTAPRRTSFGLCRRRHLAHVFDFTRFRIAPLHARHSAQTSSPPAPPRTKIKAVPAASTSLADIRARIAADPATVRISTDDALTLWREASDAELRELASLVRARFHPPATCTYMVMRIINYTNVCVAQCDYCAFYKLPGQDGGYVLTQDEVFAKLDELLVLGGDLAAFNGGFNPHLPLDYYCDLFRAILARYGDRLEFYALTIAEFLYLADHAKLSYAKAAQRFKEAGVRWITGGGSEILTEGFRRRHSKFKYTVAEYFAAQRAIVDAGLRTTATMVIGFDETIEELS